eukprot:1907374-Amphidinium_carterae.1
MDSTGQDYRGEQPAALERKGMSSGPRHTNSHRQQFRLIESFCDPSRLRGSNDDSNLSSATFWTQELHCVVVEVTEAQEARWTANIVHAKQHPAPKHHTQ